jgi:hypothetical protein
MANMCNARIFEDLPGLIDIEVVATYDTEEGRFVPLDESIEMAVPCCDYSPAP